MQVTHKWHGPCDVISVDGKYCTISFYKDGGTVVKRIQTRMLNVNEPQLTYVPLCKCSYTKKRFTKCLHCRMRALKQWAKEIERLKNDVQQALSPPNLIKWLAMNSQQKKLAVFRAMELGYIEWKIAGNRA